MNKHGHEDPGLEGNWGRSDSRSEEASGILYLIYFTFSFFLMHIQEWYVIKVYLNSMSSLNKWEIKLLSDKKLSFNW